MQPMLASASIKTKPRAINLDKISQFQPYWVEIRVRNFSAKCLQFLRVINFSECLKWCSGALFVGTSVYTDKSE